MTRWSRKRDWAWDKLGRIGIGTSEQDDKKLNSLLWIGVEF
jgi:hypothetical protein